MIALILGWVGLFCFAALLAALLFWPELAKSNPARKRGVLIILLFALISACMYALLGSPQQMLNYAQSADHKAEALAHLAAQEAAVSSQPESAEAWHALGDAYLQAGRPGMAMGAFRQTVQLSQGAPQALMAYGKAQVLASGGEVSAQAAETFRMVLLQVDDAQAKLFIAMHEAGLGNSEKAAAMLDEIISAEATPPAVRKAAQEQRANLGRK
jgi:cytochrome c-type biogenesis protein CcmH